ncbi:uncharacterized protein LOC127801907 [Diospyros lotus]|uniref:uncharacterized protein LOC127801907 n=1 Tax=Diospyros lotus TaxID=55363 RepID=UPI002256B1BF|nr:uncharacterized protein LOC127801907 [Diospyros lotus]XP_052193400.1 uncharacterized protein LOC127801907 [Diospyros lotus]
MNSPSPAAITLRPFRLADVDDFVSWAGDDRVIRWLQWTTITSKEEALAFIKNVCIPHPWRRSICVHDRNVGFVSIFPGSGDDRCRADIGYAVAVEQWGRGIATEAVKMAVSQAFQDLPDLVRLQAFVDVENRASKRVLEKAGFLREGHLRKYSYHRGDLKDVLVYSILPKDINRHFNSTPVTMTP